MSAVVSVAALPCPPYVAASDHVAKPAPSNTFQIGYGSNKKTRYMMPSGHKSFLVNNVKDLELLMMHNRTYAAEIASAVSSRKRIDIVARAKQLGVKVTNAKAKVTTEV